MKIPALLPLSVTLMFGAGTAAYAQDPVFVWPPVRGPAIFFGPFTPGPGRSPETMQHRHPPVQFTPPRIQSRPSDRAATMLDHGESDETGLIGPTFRVERDADGKLPPTYTPR